MYSAKHQSYHSDPLRVKGLGLKTHFGLRQVKSKSFAKIEYCQMPKQIKIVRLSISETAHPFSKTQFLKHYYKQGEPREKKIRVYLVLS